MSLYRMEGVEHRYRERRSGRWIPALQVDSLDVGEGEILTVVGPNGSGKSTLLRMLAFLERPVSGRVLFGGEDMWARREELVARREAPMVLQRTVLFTTSVLGNVSYGLRLRGASRAEAQSKALSALELVGMAQLARRRYNELSEGEKRRAALARVLALESRVVLLDEPTTSLDRESERIIEEQIRNVNRSRGTTLILASHNLRQAVALSTRIVTLSRGRLLAEHLDNVMNGSMQQTDQGYAYRDVRGWSYVFRTDRLGQDGRALIGEAEVPVQIAIPSSELVIGRDRESAERGPRGIIDSVRQDDSSCRVRIRLEGGPSLHAELKTSEYLEAGLNLGVSVLLTVNPGAVRVYSLSD